MVFAMFYCLDLTFFSKKKCGLNRSCSWLDVVCVILQCQHISPEMFIQKFSCFASNFCILFGSIFNIYLISFSMTPCFQDANLMANINILLFCSIYEIAFNEYGFMHVYVHIFIYSLSQCISFALTCFVSLKLCIE